MARLAVALLALLAAAAAVANLPAQASAGPLLGDLNTIMMPRAAASRACDGAVGDCGVDEGEEMGTAASAGEALRRSLARKPTTRYISYAALRADQVPCNKRGQSYYSNCGGMRQANPYHRGCSAITRCQRNMN